MESSIRSNEALVKFVKYLSLPLAVGYLCLLFLVGFAIGLLRDPSANGSIAMSREQFKAFPRRTISPPDQIVDTRSTEGTRPTTHHL
jgi:hypothetical protein